jgi:hypothetical protein
MRWTAKLRWLLLALIPLMGLVYIGCEDEPSDDGLDSFFDNNPYISDPRVSPSALTIAPIETFVTSVGEQINYSVVGGDSPYSWDVAKSSVGSIRELSDDSMAIYTVAIVEDNNVIVADRNGQAAIATILRTSRETLRIIPNSFSFSNAPPGATVQFTAAGGAPPYKDWTVSVPTLGTVNQSGLYTVQSATASGNNTLSVRDSRDSIATANVDHQ